MRVGGWSLVAPGLGQLSLIPPDRVTVAAQPLTFQLFPLVTSFTLGVKVQSDAHYSSKR